MNDDDLVAAMLTSPVGAGWLARLEQLRRLDTAPFEPPARADAGAVAAAAAHAAAAPFGSLIRHAVEAAEWVTGPWVGGAPALTAAAIRSAPARRPIAEAIVSRHGAALDAGLERGLQEWWWSDIPLDRVAARWRPLGSARRPATAWVTGTFDGLWTTTAPPVEAADALVSAWELYPGPTSRWRLAVDSGARVYEVARPADWRRLATRHPRATTSRPGTSWELPGPNQDPAAVAALAAIPGQHAVRTAMRRFVEPDWDGVATEWDGVHLTWAGFLTTEGRIIDLRDGDLAMLRGWYGERTLWLNPVLGDPRPLPRPQLSGRISGDVGIDVRHDPARRRRDEKLLAHKLGLASSVS